MTDHVHTPEPWRVGKLGSVVADSPDGITIGGATGPENVEYYGGNLICESVSEVNSYRIIACVNACAGLSHAEIMRAIANWKERPKRNIIV